MGHTAIGKRSAAGEIGHVFHMGRAHDPLVVDGYVLEELVELHILLLVGSDEVVKRQPGDRENRLAVERQRYNERVQEYNTARRRFPSNMTAKLFGFEEYPYWEVPKEAQGVPRVDFGR